MADVSDHALSYSRRHSLITHWETGAQASEQHHLSRRRSTGGILAGSELLQSRPSRLSVRLAPVDEQRRSVFLDPADHQPVDWTQSDESCVQSTSAVSSYLVRKNELASLLRARLGSLAARTRGRESASARREEPASRSSRASFFSRFRR
ncbi:hypothetical protein CDD80_341 [Ophiocordyceps camponoti-rufipedis]|uniref:Uncharacterized protein n=1 Tax=Ophiocordyceps camponoti-rufipedis TaxID=2004952 RepID=A0A2C5YM29_9HYPO|nr:hypothetical protein CDD80_341 [Ophiocordyceps camponoti-rufipedis]